MTHSAGIRRQDRRSWLAARYREWQVNRALYIATAVIMVAPTALTLLTDGRQTWDVRTAFTNQVLSYTAAYTGTSSEVLTLLAGTLGIALFWNDRSRGRLDVIVEGPMPRRQILRAKFYWGVLTLLTVAALLCLVMTTTALAVGHPELIGAVVVRSFIHAAGDTALFVTSVGLGAVVDSVLTAVGTGVWVLVPMTIAGGVGGVVASVMATRPMSQTPEIVTVAIQRLSPVARTAPQGWLGVVYALYFIAWALFIGNRALKWWERTPWERFHDPVAFPVIWNFLYALLAMLSGGVLAMGGLLTFSREGITTLNLLGISLAIAVPGWFFWRRFLWFLGRTRLGWGPGAEE